METNLIETRDLAKLYASGPHRVAALADVTFAVPPGACLGVAGPSGSGKSTLINLLGGLDTPSAGAILVRGSDIARLDRRGLALYRRCQVGMVFQSFNLIPAHTALDNVALPLLFAGVPRAERRRRAAAVLETVGLADRLLHRPAELSGGEQQRVALARALVNQPEILLADEPTGNLDSVTAGRLTDLLADLNRTRGLTVIMISHEEYLLRRLAHQIIRLQDGRIIDRERLR